MSNSTTLIETLLADRVTITLMNGQPLDCELKSVGSTPFNSQFHYFSEEGYRYLAEATSTNSKEEKDLFIANARFLLANAERIFNDSKMFLTPINAGNNMAYSGDDGFRGATLGVYLEWWIHHSDASIDGNGNPIWHISGSPMSGRNTCLAVDEEGHSVEILQQTTFKAIWESFMEVNARYPFAKEICATYILKDVIEKLKR